jgi:hypothetical protein
MTKEATNTLDTGGGKEAKPERHEGAGHATGGAVQDRQKQAEPLKDADRDTPKGPMFADTEEHRDPIDPKTGLRGRPESPSDHFGQKTRDNVNPAIPSSDPGTGGIVDPASLGMEQGGTAPRYYTDEVPVRSINEPGAPMEQSTPNPSTQEGAAPQWPYVGVDPAHPLNVPQSINEPPGSDVTPDIDEGGEGGEGEDDAPDIESLDPDEVDAGDATDITMHVHGTGFTEESVITFNGLDEPTVFVSETEVTTIVKPSLFTVPAVCPVTVKNGALESDALEFEFLDPEDPPAARETKQTTRRSKPKPKAAKKAKKKGRK